MEKFDIFDFFLEADEEETKKEEKDDKEKKDDKKEEKDDKEEIKDKEKEAEEEAEKYDDLIGDDDSFEPADDSDLSDDYNDIISSDDDDSLNDDFTTDDEYEKSSDSDDYNALIVMKSGESGEDDTAGSELYEKIAKIGYLFTIIANNMKHIHLNTCGKKFEEIHRQSEDYYAHFGYKSDHYFELAAQSPVIKLDNPTRSKEHVEDIEVETAEAYPFDIAIARMTANLNKAIDYVKSARMCSASRTDIQSSLDSELEYLNKQVNFILRKKAMSDETTPVSTPDVTIEAYNWLF